jgi:RHS repeat-associated protein
MAQETYAMLAKTRPVQADTFFSLNRMLTKNYNDNSTPEVTYRYDTHLNPPPSQINSYPKGRLTAVSTSTTSTTPAPPVVVQAVDAYDALGRVTYSTEAVGSTSYSFGKMAQTQPGYTYNLSSALTSIQYPSGKVVSYAFDGADRITTVTGSLASTANAYACNIMYAPHGAISSLQRGPSCLSGSGAPATPAEYETYNFNNRLQPTSMLLGTAAGAGNLWNLDNGFGLGTNNNGDVTAQTLTVGTWVAQESYQYDPLNRLYNALDSVSYVDATGAQHPSAASSNRDFRYDRFGNGWVVQGTAAGQALSSNTPQDTNNCSTAGVECASTWFNGTNNRMTGYNYDPDGNQKSLFGGVSLSYDAEYRLTSSVINAVATSFVYDGNGHRVMKLNCPSAAPCGYSDSEVTINLYVYDSSGDLAAEYTTGSVTAVGTMFLTQDHLGSTRATTDGNQNVTARYDYLPFGEQITDTTVGARAVVPGYGNGAPDNSPLRFTGKERDAETSLDFFGARYYSGAEGRFMSADWSAAPQPVPYARFDNPQSLNLYAYVLNDPASETDTDGHIDCTGDNAKGAGCQALAKWNEDHGISPSAKKSNFPGVPVRLPNGDTVPDPKSPTGKMMSIVADLSPVANDAKKVKDLIQGLMATGNSEGILGILIGALGRSVATGGQYDYQRVGPQSDIITGGFQQLPQFKAVSNFNVGLFAQQAGLTLNELIDIASAYARAISTNKDRSGPNGMDPETYHFTVLGYQAGKSGIYDH